jgi:26S proteasome regulatory subunit N3
VVTLAFSVILVMYGITFSKEDGSEMHVDTTAQVSIKHGLPEIEIYCYLVVLIFLIDNKKYD